MYSWPLIKIIIYSTYGNWQMHIDRHNSKSSNWTLLKITWLINQDFKIKLGKMGEGDFDSLFYFLLFCFLSQLDTWQGKEIIYLKKEKKKKEKSFQTWDIKL